MRDDINSLDIDQSIKDQILAGIDEDERIYKMKIKAVRWMSKLTLDVLQAVNYDEEKFLRQVENGNFAEELLSRANYDNTIVVDNG